MKIVMMGPPGSGKGTHAKKLAAKLGIAHISTGDLFRELAKEDTEEGRNIKKLVDSGAYISDDITCGILKNRVQMTDTKNGFILDGFPRTVKQAQMLEDLAEIDAVLYMNVSDQECLRRLSGRQTCRSCAAIYGNENQPKHQGKCDSCGGVLYVREDEKEDVVKKRLSIYHEQTEPILDFYRENGLLAEVPVEGIKQPDEVFQDVCDALGI